MPTVEGHAVPGGYSGQAVRPIALRQVMEVARANPGVAISGIGGIETGFDAAQFFLLGASTVQVCTGAMLRGYEIISELKEELAKFMVDHKFTNIREFVGKSLPYFTTHHDLVDRQKAARDAKEARARATGKARTRRRDLEGRHREGNLDPRHELEETGARHGTQSPQRPDPGVEPDQRRVEARSPRSRRRCSRSTCR